MAAYTKADCATSYLDAPNKAEPQGPTKRSPIRFQASVIRGVGGVGGIGIIWATSFLRTAAITKGGNSAKLLSKPDLARQFVARTIGKEFRAHERNKLILPWC